MLLEIVRLARRQLTWTTVLAQLQRAFEVAEFDANRMSRAGPKITLETGVERQRRCERVDDEWLSTPMPFPSIRSISPMRNNERRLAAYSLSISHADLSQSRVWYVRKYEHHCESL